MKILSHHPLSALNTFGIEAFAKEFIEIDKDDDLKDYIKDNLTGAKPMILLGGGSNMLFTGDFNGTVLKISTTGKEIVKEDEDEVHLRVAAGENWDKLVEYCVDKGWGGLENLSGIPGQVGSSPLQNIGAYGTELKDHFISLEAINRCTGEKVSYEAGDCQFGYRDSIFKRALKDRLIITHVIFSLRKNPEYNLAYQALKQKFEHLPKDEITLQKIRQAVLGIRASKLPDPKVIGNAGSFFKNPVVGNSKLEELKERFPGIVYYKVSESPARTTEVVQSGGQSINVTEGNIQGDLPTADFKLAAGWLIEQCGWKGFREGDAGVHRDQALVLVNYGKASGREILDLAGRIQRSVKEKFEIVLEREVVVI